MYIQTARPPFCIVPMCVPQGRAALNVLVALVVAGQVRGHAGGRGDGAFAFVHV